LRGAVVASRFLRGAVIASRFSRGAVIARFADGALITCYLVKVVMFFEEIGHVEKRVALQTDIHECRLHSGENARDASFMNAAGERIFVGALEINFAQLIVFDQRHFGLVPVGRDHQFLAHSGLHPAGFRRAIEDLSAYQRRDIAKAVRIGVAGQNRQSGAVPPTPRRQKISPDQHCGDVSREGQMDERRGDPSLP
jgi:hypothetical protein